MYSVATIMYRVAGSRCEEASFGIRTNVSRVTRVSSEPCVLIDALEVNHTCSLELQRLHVYWGHLRTLWRYDQDISYHREVTHIAGVRKIMQDAFDKSVEDILGFYVEGGGVISDRRPFDSFNLRKWCALNNYTKRHESSLASDINVCRLQTEIQRRRRLSRRLQRDCVCALCLQVPVVVQRGAGGVGVECLIDDMNRLSLGQGDQDHV